MANTETTPELPSAAADAMWESLARDNGGGTGLYGLIRCFDKKLPVRKGKRRLFHLWGHIRKRRALL